MFAKKDLLYHTTTGHKVFCVSVKKNNKTVVCTESAYEKAKAQLVADATNRPDEVKGNIFRYLGGKEKIITPTDTLVGYDIYKKELTKPENKKLAAELKRLESDRKKLLADLEATNQTLIEAAKGLNQIFIVAKQKTVPV